MELFSWECTSICAIKIKTRLLESDQKCLRHGSSIKPLLSLCKRDNTTEKIFLRKINLLRNSGHLYENNDVKHNISVVLFG